jgi:hypothetical protein
MSKNNRRELIRVDLIDYFWKIQDSEYSAIPLDCPVCNLLFRDRADTLSYQEVGCCTQCANVFVYPNRKRWLNSWRPSINKINKEREKRRSIPTYIIQ